MYVVSLCALVFLSFRPRRSPSVLLPSYLKRKKLSNSNPASKRPKTVQFWDLDIICIPQPSSESTSLQLAYPRGKSRGKLCSLGLVGKIQLSSAMSDEEVQQEIRSVFSVPMGGRADFPFVFLQPVGAGTKTLIVPAVSSSFCWTAQQVARLGSYKQAIYILAKDELKIPQNSDVSISIYVYYILI